MCVGATDVSTSGSMSQQEYPRAGVDLAKPLVFDTVVSAQAVGGAEGLVALRTRVLLQVLWAEGT